MEEISRLRPVLHSSVISAACRLTEIAALILPADLTDGSLWNSVFLPVFLLFLGAKSSLVHDFVNDRFHPLRTNHYRCDQQEF